MSLLQLTDPSVGGTLNGYLNTLDVKGLSINGAMVKPPFLSLSGGAMDPLPHGVLHAHTIKDVITITGSSGEDIDTIIQTVNGNDLILSTGAGDEIDINTGSLIINSTVRTQIDAVPNVTRLVVDSTDGVIIKSKKGSAPSVPYIDYTTNIDSGVPSYYAMRFNSQKAGGTQNKSLQLLMNDDTPTWVSSWEGTAMNEISSKCSNYIVETDNGGSIKHYASGGGYLEQRVDSSVGSMGAQLHLKNSAGGFSASYSIAIGDDDRPQMYVVRNPDKTQNKAVLNCAGGIATIGDYDLNNNTRIDVDDSTQTITLNSSSTTVNGILVPNTGIKDATGSTGTANQVLTAGTGGSLQWQPASSTEVVTGIAALDPTKAVSYVSGPSHVISNGSVVGFQKTIVNNGPSVFCVSGNGVDGGANGPIYKMVKATVGAGAGLIFACGDAALFQTIGTATGLNGIAVYNPTGSTIAGVPAYTWQGLKTGLQRSGVANSGIAYTMVFDLNGDLYVGGTFESADNVATTKYIAKWTVGTAGASAVWATITTNGFNGSNIRSIVSDPAGNLYLGGAFISINGVAATNVVKYVPSTGTFSALNAGISGGTQPVAGLFFDTQTGFLFAGGTLTSAGGPTTGVGYWNPSTGSWSPMGVGLIGQVNGFYRYSPTALYAYGAITNLGPNTTVGQPAGRFAVWNGSSWITQGIGATQTIVDAFADGGMYFAVANGGIQYLDMKNYGVSNYGGLPIIGSANTFLQIPGTRTYYVAGGFNALATRDQYVNNICTINLNNEVAISNFYNYQPSRLISTLYGDNISVRWNGTYWIREQASDSFVFLRS